MEKNVACIISLGDVERSINVSDGMKNLIIMENGVELCEVNVIGTIGSYLEFEKKEYICLKDESGETYVKIIHSNQTIGMEEGDLIHVMGFLNFDGKRKYVNPYIIKKIDENIKERGELRKLEIIKFHKYIDKNKEAFSLNKKKYKELYEKLMKKKEEESKTKTEEKTQADDSKDKDSPVAQITKDNIIEIIKEKDKEDKGVPYVDILDKFRDEQRENVETIIDSLLDEGLCYEPIAGKIKVL
ncbi:MAG: hypothetical protein KAQ92_03025 [Candidatus Aenigmarchaeota archaeon]|nr:hypothetical protein [Candidatus Aenigmarchaeota archaeon]